MKRKVLSGLLIMGLVFAPMGLRGEPAQAAEPTNTQPIVTHTHDDGTWQVLVINANTSSLTLWGNETYYLDKNIDLNRALTINAKGAPTLCLNGKVLNANWNSLQFNVQPGATLTICDCSNAITEGYVDQNGLWHPGKSEAEGNRNCSLTGGVITGVNIGNPLFSAISQGSQVDFQSGNIAGNIGKTEYSSIIAARNSATLNFKGGCIIGNQVQKCVEVSANSKGVISGGVIEQNQGTGIYIAGNGVTAQVTGGSIICNKSSEDGGGIAVKSHALLQLTGNPMIKDNVGKNGHNNVYLEYGKLEVLKDIQLDTKIGVYTFIPRGDSPEKHAITNNWKTHMGDKHPADYFYSEKEGCSIGQNDAGEAIFVQHAHGDTALSKWANTDALPTEGAYYLGADVQLAEAAALGAPAEKKAVLCLNGHHIQSSADTAIVLHPQSHLTLCDCPGQQAGDICGTQAGLLLNTVASTTLDQAALDATDYKGATLLVKEVNPAAAAGACAIRGPQGKFELVNSGYHYAYKDGGYYIEANTYTIDYLQADGTSFVGLPSNAPTQHIYGQETLLPVPEKAGVSFKGWYRSADCAGESVSTLTAEGVTENVTLYGKWETVVNAPTITSQPQPLALNEGQTGELSVEATPAFAEDRLSYQWVEADASGDTSKGQLLENETNATLVIPTTQKPGTYYYYCVVKAERDGVLAQAVSDIAKVTIEALPEPAPMPWPGPDGGQSSETVTHPDGSVTTTITKPNGNVIATTTYPNGDRMTLTTHEDGVVDVLLKGASPRLAIIPTQILSTGMVPVVTDAEGNVHLKQQSALTKGGVALMVHDGDSVQLVLKSPTFVDVADTHWAAKDVTFVAARGLLVGVDETHFAPEAETTRAMIWSILSRMEGVSASGGDNWYVPGQEWAMAHGVSDGTQPMNAITREQLASMLYRYAKQPVVEGHLDAFKDADAVSDWAKAAMKWAVNEGIIAGMSEDTLVPQGTATRAQTSAILQRFIAWQLGVAE